MEPAQALADLTEISTQLEAVVLASPDGSVVASTLSDGQRADGVAKNAIGLLAGARDVAGERGELTQVQVATREGCVFVVRDEQHVLAVVTGPDPTTGLVFYDLKVTLRMLAKEPERAEKPKPKAKRPAKKKAGATDRKACECVGRSRR